MENIPDKFWKEYEYTSELEKDKKISFIAERIISALYIQNGELLKHCIINYLKSYFDDIIEYKNGEIDEIRKNVQSADEPSEKVE